MLTRSPEVDAVRIEMIKRGVKLKELARRLRMRPRSLSAMLAGNVPSLVVRRKIENALGVAVWSSPKEFQGRQETAKLLGFDPEQVSNRFLRSRVRALKLAGRRGITTNAGFIALLRQYAIERREIHERKQRQTDNRRLNKTAL